VQAFVLLSKDQRIIGGACRLAVEHDPIKLGVAFRALGEQIEERMGGADHYRDVPRGKKRRVWKRKFLESLTEAAKDIREVSEEETLDRVRRYRKERRWRLQLRQKVREREPPVILDTSVLEADQSAEGRSERCYSVIVCWITWVLGSPVRLGHPSTCPSSTCWRPRDGATTTSNLSSAKT
jgi:hypothetical protein